MNKKFNIIVGIFLTVTMFGASISHAKISPNINSNSFRAIAERSTTSSPLGFQIFCLQNPQQCKTSSKKKVAYSPTLMRVASQVNRKVNRAIRPRNDRGIDKWSLNSRYGDCEDYVISKRAMLIKAGVHSGALRIATAVTKEGIGHAVLIIRTNKGDFALDNRTNTIKLWNKTGLRMIAMSGSNPKKWKEIS
ncbi:MAG: transglutaminase-like cysteine peptidase [Devosiaceae bacterium]|nr:transglutaminase-like cysteine peptidase [Devosiaceae bacterium]